MIAVDEGRAGDGPSQLLITLRSEEMPRVEEADYTSLVQALGVDPATLMGRDDEFESESDPED
jgi:hypothetical protein